MSSSNYNNVNRVLIGDGINSGVITHISGIQKGDLYMIAENGTLITTTAAAAALPRHERITLAAGIDAGVAILSSPIQGNTVSKFRGTTYVAPQEMVAILGFNGTATTGITVTADTEYRLRVHIKDAQRPNGQRLTLSDVNYTAGTGETAAVVVAKIACLYYQKDYGVNYMSDKVKLERVSNGTFAAFTNPANVIAQSKIVTSTAHTAVVGDIVRIGGITAQTPVYVVSKVIDANNFELDAPYQGATATLLAANIGELSAVTEWGFKLTGVSQNSKLSRAANEPVDEYEWISFDAAFTDADDLASSQYKALYTLVTALNPGQGFWKQVADAEEAAKGYLGDTSKRRFHDYRINSNVVVGTTYSSVIITHADIHRGDFQDTYNAPLMTEIYIPSGSAQADETAGNNQIAAILNGYFSTVLGFPAIVV